MREFDVKAIFQFTQVNKERLTKLAEFVDKQNNNNNIEIHIDKTFSLDEAKQALDYQKDVHPRGKIVLTIEK
jgi:NADPH:quinone reductase-like Zn-dependent oxidoreductase